MKKPEKRKPYIVEKTVEQWAAVEPNPRQRDTEARARKAKHLRVLLPIHAHTNMAVLPDGREIKADGHTRALMWTTGQTDRVPEAVFALAHPCRDMGEVTDLYMAFDSPAAVDNITDLLFGLCHEQGIVFESEFLNVYRFASGMAAAQQLYFGSLAYIREKVPEVLKLWTPQLLMLDKCGPTQHKFSTPATTGALLLLRAYGEAGQKFLNAFQHEQGTKGDGKMDAVQALHEYILNFKKPYSRATRGEMVRTIISTYQAYEAERGYAIDPKKGVAGSYGARPLTDRRFQQWLADTKIRLGE